jgi:hypothetical protein
MDNDVDVFLTQAEVAKRWRCSEANVKNLRVQGLINYFQFGRSVRYVKEDIIEFEKQNTKRRKGGVKPKAINRKRKPDVSSAPLKQWRI